MSAFRPLKEIIEEQKRESEAQASAKAKQAEIEKQREVVRQKRLYCADVKTLTLIQNSEELKEFVEKHKFIYRKFDAADINGVVNSLLVPENRQKTMRYIHADYSDIREGTEEESKEKFLKLLEYTRLPFVYFEARYTYANHYFIIWTEDGLWKALHFYFCRCPSGGCDSEHIDLIVGVSPQDLTGLWYFTPLYDEDKEHLFEMLKKCE